MCSSFSVVSGKGKNLCSERAETIATIVATIVAAKVGTTTAVGLCDPAEALNAMTLVGIKVIEAVLIAKNKTCALLAVPLCGFNVLSCSIARIPNGVAALPKPKRFA